MRALLALAVLATITGCITDEAAPSAEVTAAALDLAQPAAPAVAVVNLTDAAPLWLVGDAWAIRSDDGAGNTENSVLVVTRADADAYTLETTSATVAGFDAMFDVSYVGRIRASDLAGAQQGNPIEFFRFPLADGATWTTTWDGLEIALTATAAPAISTAVGTQPGFTIVGTADGAPYVEYDYVPALRWWSHLQFAAGYGFRVERAMTNWTGEVATAQAKLVYESASVAPLGGPNSGAFTVSEGQTFLAMTIAGAGSSYARALVLTDPAGAPYMTTTPNAEGAPTGGAYFYYETLPPTPGQWHVGNPTLHDPEGSASIRIHEVLVGTKTIA